MALEGHNEQLFPVAGGKVRNRSRVEKQHSHQRMGASRRAAGSAPLDSPPDTRSHAALQR